MPRSTPCVGICSTTYGDLVCRGCKRFAHEIVEWNGYATNQRLAIWQRLGALRDAVVADRVQVIDPARFETALNTLRVIDERASSAGKIYELLRRLAPPGLAPSAAGIRLHHHTDDQAGVRAVLSEVDRDFYDRSRAYYERSFRTLT